VTGLRGLAPVLLVLGSRLQRDAGVELKKDDLTRRLKLRADAMSRSETIL